MDGAALGVPEDAGHALTSAREFADMQQNVAEECAGVVVLDQDRIVFRVPSFEFVPKLFCCIYKSQLIGRR